MRAIDDCKQFIHVVCNVGGQLGTFINLRGIDISYAVLRFLDMQRKTVELTSYLARKTTGFGVGKLFIRLINCSGFMRTISNLPAT